MTYLPNKAGYLIYESVHSLQQMNFQSISSLLCVRTKVAKDTYSLTSKYVVKNGTVALYFYDHFTTSLKDKIIH